MAILMKNIAKLEIIIHYMCVILVYCSMILYLFSNMYKNICSEKKDASPTKQKIVAQTIS